MHTYARGCIEKSLGTKEKTNNKLKSHTASTPGFTAADWFAAARTLGNEIDSILTVKTLV